MLKIWSLNIKNLRKDMGLCFVVLNMLNVDMCNWGAIILAINYLLSLIYFTYLILRLLILKTALEKKKYLFVIALFAPSLPISQTHSKQGFIPTMAITLLQKFLAK